jgi:hypothetical protein
MLLHNAISALAIVFDPLRFATICGRHRCWAIYFRRCATRWAD